ncbi:Uncharacterised protein [Candidatus Burarchaeum australiense]|nr:Uncharacterised protein [Candidatus Burarchaeum australiense]
MEFLTTYGWAILIIVIVLAALAWLGVFNVTNKVSESCSIQPELRCDPVRVVVSDNYGPVRLQTLRITNYFPERILVGGIMCRTGAKGPVGSTVGDYKAPGAGVISIGPGSTAELVTTFGTVDWGVSCYSGDQDPAVPDVALEASAGDLLTTKIYIGYIKESDSNPDMQVRLASGIAVSRVEGVS